MSALSAISVPHCRQTIRAAGSATDARPGTLPALGPLSRLYFAHVPLRDVIPSAPCRRDVPSSRQRAWRSCSRSTLAQREPSVFIQHMGLHSGGLLAADHLLVDVPARGLVAPGRQHVVLWIFGDNVEDRLGHGRFSCSTCSLACWPRWRTRGAIRVDRAHRRRDGAIAGVMGAYFVLYPHRGSSPGAASLPRVEIPAVVFLGFGS